MTDGTMEKQGAVPETAAFDKTAFEKAAFEKAKEFIPFAGLVLVAVFFQAASGGKLITVRNFPVFVNHAFAIIAASCGAVFVMAQGNIDFSLAANVCVTAALTALASRISIPLAVVTALACGSFIGLLNGLAVTVLGLPSFIATLAASYIYTGLANALLGAGSLAADYGMKKLDKLPLKLAILGAALGLCFLLLEFSPFGKQSKAIGSRAEVARQAGVNINARKAAAFVIAGFACGIVALISITRTCTASPQTGASLQINTMLALLLGGIPFSGGWASRFRAVIVGSLLMAVVTNGLVVMGIDTLAQQIIKGVLFVLAVAISFDRKNATVIK